MHLECRYCREIQPVTLADAADEDARTQAIRHAFREQHAACGLNAVSLVVATANGPEMPTDQPAWMTAAPQGVQLNQADGYFTRPLRRFDGAIVNVRVCEDCWSPIPHYREFPFGLTSPESDQAEKVRAVAVGNSWGYQHYAKAVCLPCYVEAFRRAYPGAAVPDLCADVVGGGTLIEPPALPKEDYADQPKEAA